MAQFLAPLSAIMGLLQEAHSFTDLPQTDSFEVGKSWRPLDVKIFESSTKSEKRQKIEV